MVTLDYTPTTPLEALVLAEAHVRALGYPQLSPLEFIRASRSHREVVGKINFFSPKKLTKRELLPGLKLRSGPSEIQVVRLLPTDGAVVYRSKGELKRTATEQFLQLANQQGYRKVWDLAAFLRTLKQLLKPVLAAIPLMWVLKLVINSVRKSPINFASSLPKGVKL